MLAITNCPTSEDTGKELNTLPSSNVQHWEKKGAERTREEEEESDGSKRKRKRKCERGGRVRGEETWW